MNLPMTVAEVNEYVKSHGIVLPTDQVFLTKSLHCFKKVFTYRGTPGGTEPDKAPFTPSYRRYWGEILEAYTSNNINSARGRLPAIANLIIPKGSIVNLASALYPSRGYSLQSYDKKLRASFALCYSIVRMVDQTEVKVAVSEHDPTFKYWPIKGRRLPGEIERLKDYPSSSIGFAKVHYIYPRAPFSMDKNGCSSGIHFFVELQNALDY